MTAVNLNTIRRTIEEKLVDELNNAPPIPIVFNNMPYKPLANTTFVLSELSFDQNEYLTQDGRNLMQGQLTLNVFTKVGVGVGQNLTVATRLRNLFNRFTLDELYFEPPNGPQIIENAAPEGYFQSRLACAFQIIEKITV
tara:strand:- start:2342 stop:2761 length:420 start_codon:yes stop_codon:yes gene_type:complete